MASNDDEDESNNKKKSKSKSKSAPPKSEVKSREKSSKSQSRSKSGVKPKSRSKSSTSKKKCKPTSKKPPRMDAIIAKKHEDAKREMTRHYQIPSKHFKTKEDVIKAFGYRLEEELDKGSFGTVYIANDNRKNIKVACKWMNLGTLKNDPRMRETRNELLILEEVRHPYVIKVQCHFLVQADGINNMYIFMELANGGNFYKFLRKRRQVPGEAEAKKYFAQMLCGVNHMHGYRIAHRDLKLQNILLVEEPRSISGDYLLRVSDFGTSTLVKRDADGNVLNKTLCGTPVFMPPEMLDRLEYDAFKVDIWALGICLYIMLTMESPFEFKNRKFAEVSADMKGGKWEWRTDKLKDGQPSEELEEFTHLMLQPDPEERVKLPQVIRHQWIARDYKAAHDLSDQIKKEEIEAKRAKDEAEKEKND